MFKKHAVLSNKICHYYGFAFNNTVFLCYSDLYAVTYLIRSLVTFFKLLF